MSGMQSQPLLVTSLIDPTDLDSIALAGEALGRVFH